MENIQVSIENLQTIEAEVLAKKDEIMADARTISEYLGLIDDLRHHYQQTKENEEKTEEFYKAKDLERILGHGDNGRADSNFGVKTPTKSNNQVYEEILDEAEKPLYLDEILRRALRRGVNFKGKKNPPRKQLRVALNGGKQFVLVGNNVWWLSDRPIPGQENGNQVQ